jgi:SAM-dependent methyltransferase
MGRQLSGLTQPADADGRRASYTTSRRDVLAALPTVSGAVLDVGCSDGSVGVELARRGLGPLWGIELDEELAAVARTRLDEVLVGPVEQVLDDPRLDGQRFDLVIAADVLEHLVDPWAVYARLVDLLEPGGHILVSVPNVAFWDTFWNLLRGRWPRRDRGIHDATHLRWFGRRDVEELVASHGVTVVSFRRNRRLVERPHPVNRLAPLVAWIWPNLFTFQFVVVGRKGVAPS